jgi:hydrogenase maturation protein HypF
LKRYRLTVAGVVQGVGFRPFVKRLADRLSLAGRVWNTGGGLVVDIEGERACEFRVALEREAPANARLASCGVEELPEAGYRGFDILPSEPAPGAFTLISPDLATCPACLRELRDPTDRRYRYAFINCTDCGPRYSIVRAVPYDRANTTMSAFTLCRRCAAEYADSGDRRFHAEPNACPACGPKLAAPVADAIAVLARGGVVAVKSTGGFQLACNAFDAAAVRRLRAAKRRGGKPFAVMMRDIETAARWCRVGESERALLASRAAPIVLVPMHDPAAFPGEPASGLPELGVMLPYTPLHHLLFDGPFECLVMTSGNLSEEPIVTSNEEARRVLGPLCDLVLDHDREIRTRVDDSVVRPGAVLRRARGYAPEPIDLGFDAGGVLAVGGELKNAFCLTRGRYAVLSQHIGDLENYETLQFFEETLASLKETYRAEPQLIAHDLHPDYLSTRWAQRQPGPHMAVQHHHAHIVSCMAEHGLRGRVIGFAFDGTGYGTDGQVWGGEALVCDAAGFERAAHLRYIPLPGGDRASREGWRMALAHALDAYGFGWRGIDLGVDEARLRIVERVCAMPATVRTSSCGRLFDAVAALTSVARESSYEGEAAMLLEAAAGGGEDDSYPVALAGEEIDTRPLIRAVCEDVRAGASAATVSRRFHAALAVMMESVAVGLRERAGLDRVCLSGGTFQNVLLAGLARRRLERAGFEVFAHRLVPANDGGLALGQAAIAAGRI